MHAASNTQDWMLAVDIFMQGNHISYGWWNSSFVVSVVCFVFFLKFPLNEQTLEFLFLPADFWRILVFFSFPFYRMTCRSCHNTKHKATKQGSECPYDPNDDERIL